ncbi:MAG: heme exporter protein CcmB [Thermoplasmatota archaeon]
MKFSVLLRKDLRREWRSKHVLQAGAVLVALFFVVGLFAFQNLQDSPRAAAFLLWTPILFSTAAMVGRAFGNEHDLGTLAWLQSLPFPTAWIGWSRTLVDGFVALFLVGLSALLARAVFEIPLSLPLLALLGLATIGLAVMGSLSAAIATQAAARELLLPLLLIPVAAPLLMAGVKGTMQVLVQPTWESGQSSLLLLLAYDAIAIGLAAILWQPLLEDA